MASRYRKVDPRIWNDKKFRNLSDQGKLAFFFLLTHPHMTSIGAMRGTIAGLAEELGWDTEAFREAFREALSKGMAKHDPKACFIALPNFLKYNRPESPNVVKAWESALDLLPECSLKMQVIHEAKGYAEGLSKAFGEALPEAFAKAMPYQEQEQEQDISTPNGVDAGASKERPDPIWGSGLAFLKSKGIPEKSARSLLGKIKKSAGDVGAAKILADAQAEDITDPAPWILTAASNYSKNSHNDSKTMRAIQALNEVYIDEPEQRKLASG